MRVILATFASFVALFAVSIEAAPYRQQYPAQARSASYGRTTRGARMRIHWRPLARSVGLLALGPMRSEMVGKGTFLPPEEPAASDWYSGVMHRYSARITSFLEARRVCLLLMRTLKPTPRTPGILAACCSGSAWEEVSRTPGGCASPTSHKHASNSRLGGASN
jgi:hypothetical protein